MNPLHCLKIKWEFFTLDAPAFTWLAFVVLIIVPFVFMARLSFQVLKQRALYKRLQKQIVDIGLKQDRETRDGLLGPTYDALVAVLSRESEVQSAWISYNSQIVLKRRRDGTDAFWSTESAHSYFGREALIEGHINKTFYNAIPGIVTGFGLLCTFLAILVALLDVRLVDNRVQGLGL